MRALRLIVPLAGLIGWSAAFLLLYGLHGLGCANGWDRIELGPTNVQRGVQVGTWLACLPLLACLAWRLRAMRLSSTGGPGERWLAALAETLGWVGLVATAFTLFPVLATSVCR
jgi:hypothetical protein